MKCPHCGNEINPAQMLGAITSEKKAAASRANLIKGGGRPKGAKDLKPRKRRSRAGVE